jgi:hypothetical protein
MVLESSLDLQTLIIMAEDTTLRDRQLFQQLAKPEPIIDISSLVITVLE